MSMEELILEQVEEKIMRYNTVWDLINLTNELYNDIGSFPDSEGVSEPYSMFDLYITHIWCNYEKAYMEPGDPYYDIFNLYANISDEDDEMYIMITQEAYNLLFSYFTDTPHNMKLVITSDDNLSNNVYALYNKTKDITKLILDSVTEYQKNDELEINSSEQLELPF